jgi:uncharacterized protein (DUF1684 family)
MSALPEGDLWSLLDYRRRVFGLYARVRSCPDPEDAWRQWCRERDDLLLSHSQSPIAPERRKAWGGLDLYDYDPSWRVLAEVAPASSETYEVATSGEGTMTVVRFGTASFGRANTALSLGIYWIAGYGGGVFLPFRDTTSGRETYGAGRYLLDTVKGADLGTEGGRLVLDFNFSYNPSCAYDPRWVCPLAPPANRLGLAVRAGERTPRLRA